ncbi:MAG: 2-keto-4-pentenoate hydratase/2-oxohepta-3-ene-1,7-dioic acid hydratase in catechol pathway [Myxococcota bacterium]
MKLARFLDPDGHLRIGRVLTDGRLQPLIGDLFSEHEDHGDPIDATEVTLLAPVIPSKVVALATNYHAHAVEMGKSIPAVPKLFIKPSTAVIGPNTAILLPPGTQRVDHEAELAVVIGRTMTRTPAAQALDHVLGYTALNDVTARDFQRADGQFTRGKGFDSFCPLGPYIVTDIDPSDLRVRCWVDGELRQDGRTSDLIFDIPTMLAFISSVMTLLPGDVVATGTPSGVGPLLAGQEVSIEIEQIGTLSNPILDREDRNG